MNKRQSEILKVLYRNHSFMTFAEIAEQMNVSVKTVRNDVVSLKEYLLSQNAGTIETKPHAGIKLNMTESEWNNLSKEDEIEEKEIIFFILRHLMKNGSLTAQRLSEQYYIGRSRIDKILDFVSDWFYENHILFERRRGKGISIQYSEFNYRLASLELYNEYIPLYSELVHAGMPKYTFMTEKEYTAMCASLSGFEADGIAKAISETEHEFGFCFNYSSGVNLLFLTSLCILRSRSGNYVKMPAPAKCPTDGSSKDIFAKSLIKKIESGNNMVFSEEETKFIAFAVEISEIREFESEDARRSFEAMNIELCRLTVKIVNLISEIAGVDLREDRFFVKQMFLQLKVTIARLKYGIVCKNQLLPQIKTTYPNMMAIAWFLGNIFEKELRLELNEHEVGFIALHIGGAIERQLSGLSACIVCDYGIGISQILMEKITRVMPELKITAVLSGRDIHRIKKEQCDFVISSAPLDGYRLSKDIVTVGHLLDEQDIKNLEGYIKKAHLKKSGGVKNISPHTSLFSSELIFPHCRISDKKQLLHMMCSRLESLGYVTDGFERSVMEREKSTPTDIGKGFALPHGLSRFVNHSVAAFASVEKPIEWSNGEFADKVLLVAFDLDESKEMKEKIIRFYKSVVSFMEDEAACESLQSLTDTKQIMKIFELW